MNLEEFLWQVPDHGPCDVHAATPSPLAPPPRVELRTVNGARTTTLDGLFDAFAEAWHFPPRFAHNHNRDAFDDWMRDFDNLTNPALDKPPGSGYPSPAFHSLDARRGQKLQRENSWNLNV
jgi:hypothetical protein